jgi:hypothetical protein
MRSKTNPGACVDTNNGTLRSIVYSETTDDNMGRRRLQQDGNLYQQSGWWKLRWREDVKLESGVIARKWSKPAWIGPSIGKQRLTEKEARRIAWENFLSKLDQNNVVPRSIITLEAFVENYFKPQHVALKKTDTRAFYNSQLKHIVPVLGDMRLRDITTAHVQRLVATKLNERYLFTRKKKKWEEKAPAPELRKYSSRQIQAIATTVSAIFTKAEKLEMFTGRNPAKLLDLPEMVPVRKKQALTLPGYRKLLGKLPEPAHGLAFTATVTTMNIAEACGTRWEYVNLTDKWESVNGEGLPPYTLAVRWQWSNGEYGTVKRKKRRRFIPMPRVLVIYLTELKKRSKFTGPNDPVFAGRTGKPVDEHNLFNRVLKPIATSLGMPWVGWHTFRRTASTLFDEFAMAMSDRMAMMGHGSAAMTMHYTDEDLERRRQVLDKIAEALTSVDTETLQ